jgi:hypothetical protein
MDLQNKIMNLEDKLVLVALLQSFNLNPEQIQGILWLVLTHVRSNSARKSERIVDLDGSSDEEYNNMHRRTQKVYVIEPPTPKDPPKPKEFKVLAESL